MGRDEVILPSLKFVNTVPVLLAEYFWYVVAAVMQRYAIEMAATAGRSLMQQQQRSLSVGAIFVCPGRKCACGSERERLL